MDDRIGRIAAIAFGAVAGVGAALHVGTRMDEVCRNEVERWRRARRDADAEAARLLADRVAECTYGVSRDVR